MLEDGIILEQSKKEQQGDWCKGLVGQLFQAVQFQQDTFIPILHSLDLEEY